MKRCHGYRGCSSGPYYRLPVPIVSDYDDAVFHRYDRHRFAPVCWLLGRKIDRVMKSSQLVTAGNAYLADRARKAVAVHVEVVPTVVDLSAYSVRFRSFSNTAVRVGWIGTPNTWNAFGKTLHTQINDTLTAHGAQFCAVGAELEARACWKPRDRCVERGYGSGRNPDNGHRCHAIA